MQKPSDTARLDQMSAAARDAVQDVADYYAALASALRTAVRSGRITRQGAIVHLCTSARLTETGAADILDRC